MSILQKNKFQSITSRQSSDCNSIREAISTFKLKSGLIVKPNKDGKLVFPTERGEKTPCWVVAPNPYKIETKHKVSYSAGDTVLYNIYTRGWHILVLYKPREKGKNVVIEYGERLLVTEHGTVDVAIEATDKNPEFMGFCVEKFELSSADDYETSDMFPILMEVF